VDAIYLSPINRTVTYADGGENFGYAVTDYFDLRPSFGTQKDFKDFIAAAHARGIKVVMDFVPNHTSDQHPEFVAAQKEGPGSRYWDHYARDADGNPTHYFDWTDLPNRNFDDPAVVQATFDAFAFWVREFDIDGFRVDAAWGIQERRPDFYALLRDHLNDVKPGVALIAEASARDEAYRKAGFNAAYDWTEKLGNWAWAGVFEKEDGVAQRLHDALTRGAPSDPGGIFRFLNNNDTGARFITRFGEARTRTAAALLLTLPGVPLIYTGDEVGAEFLPYGPDQGKVISFADTRDLRAHYTKLIALRKKLSPLRSKSWTPLPFDHEGNWYAYLRHGKRGGAPVLVVLNFGHTPVAARIELPEPWRGHAPAELIDRMSGEEVPFLHGAEGALYVAVPAHGARIMTGLPSPRRMRRLAASR
jgi:glycosidase